MKAETSFDTTVDLPDRFFFNEMKKVITDVDQLYRDEELAQASSNVDIDLLGDLIVEADAINTGSYTSIINSNKVVGNQLWSFLDANLNETKASRGYGNNDDIRSLAVSLSAGVIKVARLIDRVKVDRLGREASTSFTNAYSSNFASEASLSLVEMYPDAILSDSASFMTKFANEAFKKVAIEKGNVSWSWSKVYTVAEHLSSLLTTRKILEELPKISDTDAGILKIQNGAIADAATFLQAYTPKPAIGALEGTDIQTLYVDKEVHVHTMITNRPLAKFTPVRLFPGYDLDSSNVELVHKRAHKDRGGVAKRIQVENMPDPVSQCEVIIYDNRELLVHSHRLADFAKAINAENQEALLTSMLLSQNFDLIVPSYIVDLANEDAENIPSDSTMQPQADKLRRLLLARTKVLQILGNDINDEMKSENADSNLEYKGVVNHGVVGHLRRIPQGYKAGQLAQKLCKEQLGIELPEGHTYVQIHRRGNLEMSSRGHKIVKNAKSAGKITLGHDKFS